MEKGSNPIAQGQILPKSHFPAYFPLDPSLMFRFVTPSPSVPNLIFPVEKITNPSAVRLQAPPLSVGEKII